jgi:SAM-dependent methyltransferase
MQLTFTVRLDPAEAFTALVDELHLALNRLEMDLQPGPQGRLLQNGEVVARITHWEPPQHAAVEWMATSWQRGDPPQLDVRLVPDSGGTRVTVEQPAWSARLDNDALETVGWFAGELVAPLLAAISPQRLGDWITDRRARRPTGPQARATYRDPIYHRPNFLAILDVLRLQPSDNLVEIGCGAGAFLLDALRSGCRAAAIDHSADMVRTASELNRESIASGRLEILEADASSLPFLSGAFTCAVTTGVFGFIEDPESALAEIFRVLAPSGRFVLFTAGKALRGTPAAPEPMASRLHFYEESELEGLVCSAGFARVRFEHPDFETLAKQAGVPQEAIPLYGIPGTSQLLVAQKAQPGE